MTKIPAERTLQEKVYAALHFGAPVEAHQEILSELTEWTRDEHPKVRWYPSDLDRCEHGRHSSDSCFDCPYGKSSGNLFLSQPNDYTITELFRRAEDGRLEVRIGTMVRGEAIWVVAHGGSR